VRKRVLLVTVAVAIASIIVVSGPVSAAPTVLTAPELTGEAEVNDQGEPNQGDLDGTGSASITLNQMKKRVCFSIQTQNIKLPATMAHIHKAPAGSPGPIKVTLKPPKDDDGDGEGTSSGCVRNVSRALIRDIKNNPSGYYVNVHNDDFTAGAVRGQLST
jgi:CHRD domain